MINGKKEVAEKTLYQALTSDLEEKIKKDYPSFEKGFVDLILKVSPEIKTRTRRMGGTNYQIPAILPLYRRMVLGMTIIKEVAREKKGIGMVKALNSEFFDILDGKGNAIKKREAIQKMAQANKAFAHLA